MQHRLAQQRVTLSDVEWLFPHSTLCLLFSVTLILRKHMMRNQMKIMSIYLYIWTSLHVQSRKHPNSQNGIAKELHISNLEFNLRYFSFYYRVSSH